VSALPEAGVRVRHPLFGEGVVRAVSGSGRTATITVDFSPAVGTKKLLASLAKLSFDGSDNGLDEDDDDAPKTAASVPAQGVWVETLVAQFDAPRGIRASPQSRLAEELLAEPRTEAFWFAVRERLRDAGFAPRVIDAVDGNVSLRVEGNLTIALQVRHAELLRPEQRVLAAVLLELLRARRLRGWNAPRVKADYGPGIPFDEARAIRIQSDEAAPEELPDRAPLRRPLRQAPKGTIFSAPRRPDDAR
jgi:hypothetical protein